MALRIKTPIEVFQLLQKSMELFHDDDDDDDDDDELFSLISSGVHCQRSSPSRIFDTQRAGFEPAQNLGSGLDE